MTHITGRVLVTAVALALAAPLATAPAYAQFQAQAPQRAYAQAELDQMLAPIALYPDPLLSQVLMAATYPIEVTEAARWSRANPGLQGDDAVRAVQFENWDPSVRSLVAFPQILQRMDEQFDWMQALGNAFLAQQSYVMDSVQQLRRQARAAGQLYSDERQNVFEQSNAIAIQPFNPQIIYVPYYDPRLVYGSWRWPSYQPVYWSPWPGYARAYRPGVSVGFWWGSPVGLSLDFFFGNFDWQHRQARVVHVNNYYYQPAAARSAFVNSAPGRWQHDPERRRGNANAAPDAQRRFANQAAAQPSQVQRQTPQRQVQQQVQQPQVVQPQAVQPQARPQRDERRAERDAARTERAQNRPAVPQVQARPQIQPQVQPPQVQPPQVQQPQARPQRDERRAERGAERAARPQAPAQAPVQARPLAQERQARMPAAVAPQQPRAERQEPRRGERNERGAKGGERS